MIEDKIIELAQEAIEQGPKGKEVAKQLKAIVLRWYPGNEKRLNEALPLLSNVAQRKVKTGPPTFKVFKGGQWVDAITGKPVSEVAAVEKKTTVAEAEIPLSDEDVVSLKDATDEEIMNHFGNIGKVKQYARAELGLSIPRSTKKPEILQMIREASV